jgi:hypothetical protein
MRFIGALRTAQSLNPEIAKTASVISLGNQLGASAVTR